MLIKPHCLIHGLPDGFVGCDSLVFVVFVCLLFFFLVKLKDLGEHVPPGVGTQVWMEDVLICFQRDNYRKK